MTETSLLLPSVYSTVEGGVVKYKSTRLHFSYGRRRPLHYSSTWSTVDAGRRCQRQFLLRFSSRPISVLIEEIVVCEKY